MAHITNVELSTEELREAISEWCAKNALSQPNSVTVTSHAREVFTIHLDTVNKIQFAGCTHRIQGG